jgi:hypothetical protein
MKHVVTRGSQASKAIENAWGALRLLYPQIPPAVVVVLSARERRRRGHFAHSAWSAGPGGSHEVAISPALFKDPKAVLATMLHEAGHAILWRSEGGVTGAYYHRHQFRDVCRDLGLACEFHNTRYGWTRTGWPKTGVPKKYDPIIRSLAGGLPEGAAGSLPGKVKPGRLPPKGLIRLRCKCRFPRTILVSKRSLPGAIHCGTCGREFAAP